MAKTATNQRWRALFQDFLTHLKIDSKDFSEPISLADQMFGSQKEFMNQVCDGLDEGVKHVVVLKSRQQGISTISLALDLFWLLVHPGLQGALITDTDGNRDKFRIILERYIESLPKSLRVGIKKHNRNNLVFDNGSVLDYIVAGVRKSGSLGRGRALNFVHCTECSSWGDPEGVASLMASLSEKHPSRLYIFESTARGFNLFWDMWKNAQADTESQKAIFLGWWTKEDYSVKKGSDVYKKYWDGILTGDEQELVDAVKTQYKFTVKPEQIAWYRWKEATRMSGDGMMAQEFPWTEQQAFISTGKGFFNKRQLARDVVHIFETGSAFKAYRYHLGDDFLATEVEQLTGEDGQLFSMSEVELKVWEDPSPSPLAKYVMGIDPAHGRSDYKDRHCISIWRCYADKLVQVAEYAVAFYDSKTVAWVMCHLAGMYKNIILNLEVTGPGRTVMNELDHLKMLMNVGYLQKRASEAGMRDFFAAVSWYLYHRPDSMGAGYCYNWQTTTDSKLLIMNQFRDRYSSNELYIPCNELLEEMQTITQEGASIEAEGSNKDDRVFAAALAIEAWARWVRPGMIARGETLARVTEDETKPMNLMTSFVEGVITDTFARKEQQRVKAQFDAAWE
jgi:hypothetical protein